MTTIINTFIREKNITQETNNTELKIYSSELLPKLTDRKVRNRARKTLKNNGFSSEQVSALIPDQRKSEINEIIRKDVKRILATENPIAEAKTIPPLNGICGPVRKKGRKNKITIQKYY